MSNRYNQQNQVLDFYGDSGVNAKIIEGWWRDGKAQNAEFEDLLLKGEKRYRNEPPLSKPAFKNGSNLNIPITSTTIDSSRNYIVDTLLGDTPMPKITSKGDTPEQNGHILTAYLRSYFASSSSYRQEIEKFIHKTLLHGVSALYIDWYESVSMVTKRGFEVDPETEMIMPVLKQELKKISFPRITQVDIFDIVVSPTSTCINPERGANHAKYVIIKRVFSEEILKDKAYDQEAVAKLVSLDDLPNQNDSIKEAQKYLGISSPRNIVEGTNLGYEGWECWYYQDEYIEEIDGFIKKLYMYVVIDNKGAPVLVRKQECPYYHYSIPLVIHQDGFDGSFYPLPLPEKIAPIQDEINVIHNQRRDNNYLALSGMWTRKLTGKFDDNQEFGPGAMIDVMDHDDLRPLRYFENGVATSTYDENALNMYLQKLTGISDIMQGLQSGLNPNSTATGTIALRNASLLQIRSKVRSLKDGAMKELLGKMVSLVQQYAPVESKIEKKHVPEELEKDLDQGLLRVLASDLVGEFDYTFDLVPDAVERNMTIQRIREAIQILGTLDIMKGNLKAQRDMIVKCARAFDLDITVPPIEELEQEQAIALQTQLRAELEMEKAKAEIQTQSRLQTDGAKGKNRITEKVVEGASALEVAKTKTKGNLINGRQSRTDKT